MILYFLKFIMAFCSIAYELLLAQTLSAFLENTVLRYSVTIGLYMFSLGVGAILADRRLIKAPLLTLLRLEILLTIIGGGCVVMLHLVDAFVDQRWVFSLVAHALIIARDRIFKYGGIY